MLSINFALRGTYSFDAHAAALLGTNFKNVTILAIMDADTASREIDIVALHKQIFPLLPAGTPNDPRSYDYVKIQTTAGHTTILGMAWINETTVTQITSTKITAVIGNVSATDAIRVKNALLQNGFKDIAITVG
ncbi:MAG: hypothetical protein ACD_84C00035G0004 [uncultured bacterium]|nr:MAG: hypothetical protein ACD_84C00035G0004 [uncultured bacterium]